MPSVIFRPISSPSEDSVFPVGHSGLRVTICCAGRPGHRPLLVRKRCALDAGAGALPRAATHSGDLAHGHRIPAPAQYRQPVVRRSGIRAVAVRGRSRPARAVHHPDQGHVRGVVLHGRRDPAGGRAGVRRPASGPTRHGDPARRLPRRPWGHQHPGEVAPPAAGAHRRQPAAPRGLRACGLRARQCRPAGARRARTGPCRVLGDPELLRPARLRVQPAQPAGPGHRAGTGPGPARPRRTPCPHVRRQGAGGPHGRGDRRTPAVRGTRLRVCERALVGAPDRRPRGAHPRHEPGRGARRHQDGRDRADRPRTSAPCRSSRPVTADPSIVIRQLRREFRIRGGRGRPATQVTALHGIDLEIPHGSVYGLLGPNGAGKTTLTRILATLLVPTSGSAHVLGLDVQRDLRAVRKTVAVVFGGDSGLYDRLSARDNLRYFAELYGIPPRVARPRAAELLEQFRLSDVADRPVEGFSRGMRQRLHLARGLLHDPRVVLLDEPTNGIDPVGARELRQVISGLRDAGKTILLTTHYMFEAEELCDTITVMNKGRIVATGTAKELRAAATLAGWPSSRCAASAMNSLRKSSSCRPCVPWTSRTASSCRSCVCTSGVATTRRRTGRSAR
ncbi:ATP-binding cassette domain-containing protein [Streptomyces tuirus]|uniref:ATP-binding cassette domain-containing protein n=1 Tax=Streptomyces tuirus TaxID=68278 RepID=A0A941J391_9ACTN|nr:ATP-binding cassette domain-containing protein [Streptomyces tuirus]